MIKKKIKKNQKKPEVFSCNTVYSASLMVSKHPLDVVRVGAWNSLAAFYEHSVIDWFTIPLTAGLSFRLRKGGVGGFKNKVEIITGLVNTECIVTEEYKLYLDQPTIKHEL